MSTHKKEWYGFRNAYFGRITPEQLDRLTLIQQTETQRQKLTFKLAQIIRKCLDKGIEQYEEELGL